MLSQTRYSQKYLATRFSVIQCLSNDSGNLEQMHASSIEGLDGMTPRTVLASQPTRSRLHDLHRWATHHRNRRSCQTKSRLFKKRNIVILKAKWSPQKSASHLMPHNLQDSVKVFWTNGSTHKQFPRIATDSHGTRTKSIVVRSTKSPNYPVPWYPPFAWDIGQCEKHQHGEIQLELRCIPDFEVRIHVSPCLIPGCTVQMYCTL